MDRAIFVFLFVTFGCCQAFSGPGDVPRQNDALRLFVGGDAPMRQRPMIYDQAARDALKERLLRDYQMKLLQQQRDQQQEDDDELYFDHGESTDL